MYEKKLYAFSRPIKDFLEIDFTAPINVHGKDLNVCVLASNSHQLEDLGATKLQDVLGASMHDLFSCDVEIKSLIYNDLAIMRKKSNGFFLEELTWTKSKAYKIYFSIKTPLKDSSNHVVGCFGLSCEINRISLAQLASVLNELNLTCSSEVLSKTTLPILKHSFSILTKREQECVYCLTRGMTYKEMGKLWGISPRTIEKHIEHIKHKLDCGNRADIISKVFESTSN